MTPVPIASPESLTESMVTTLGAMTFAALAILDVPTDALATGGAVTSGAIEDSV